MNKDNISNQQRKKIKSKIKKLFNEKLDNLEISRITLSYNMLELKLNTIVEIIILEMKLNNNIQLDSDSLFITDVDDNKGVS